MDRAGAGALRRGRGCCTRWPASSVVDRELDEDFGVFELGRPRVVHRRRAGRPPGARRRAARPEGRGTAAAGVADRRAGRGGRARALPGVGGPRGVRGTAAKPRDGRPRLGHSCRDGPDRSSRCAWTCSVRWRSGCGARPVDVPGARRRALLALLALEADRAVGTDRLVDSLWPDDPPDNAVQALYNHVSRLRGHSARWRPAGAAARGLPAAPRAVRARRRRGPSRSRAADPAARRWSCGAGRRWRSSGRCALEVELGRRSTSCGCSWSTTCCGPAGCRGPVTVRRRGAAAGAPLRERRRCCYVRALAATGGRRRRWTAAQAFRRRLAEETGLDPSPALAELEQRVAAGRRAAVRRTGDGSPAGRPAGRSEHDREEVLRLLGPTRPSRSPAPAASARPGSPSTSRPTRRPADARRRRPRRRRPARAGLPGGRLDAGAAHTARSALDDVAAALAGRELLLVLDNCEHVADACRELVVAVRRAAPRRAGARHVAGDAAGAGGVRRAAAAAAGAARRRRPGGAAAAAGGAGVRGARAAAPPTSRRRRRTRPTSWRCCGGLDGLPARDRARRPSGRGDAARGGARAARPGARPRHRTASGPRTTRQRTLRATHRVVVPAARRPTSSGCCGRIAPFPGGVDLATVEALASSPDARPARPAAPAGRLVAAGGGRGDRAVPPAVHRARLPARRGGARGRAERGASERFVDRCLDVAGRSASGMLGPDEPATDRRLRAELDNLRPPATSPRRAAVTTCASRITLRWARRHLAGPARDLGLGLELAEDPARRPPDRVPGARPAAEAARLVGDLDRAARCAGRRSPCRRGRRPDAGRAVPARPRRPSRTSGATSPRPATGSARRRAAAGTRARGSPRRRWPRGTAVTTSAPVLLARARAGTRRRAERTRVRGVRRRRARGRPTQRDEAIPYYVEAIALARRAGANFVEGVAGWRWRSAAPHRRPGRRGRGIRRPA